MQLANLGPLAKADDVAACAAGLASRGKEAMPEVLHALRGEFGADNPAVVFCTTENEISRIEQAIEGGANEYIMKPFDAEIIQSKLAQVGLL